MCKTPPRFENEKYGGSMQILESALLLSGIHLPMKRGIVSWPFDLSTLHRLGFSASAKYGIRLFLGRPGALTLVSFCSGIVDSAFDSSS